MYLGNFLKTSSGPSYTGILFSTDEGCATSNFWRSSNSGVYSTVATPGLIDDRLTYEGGESYITTSNPDNGRSAKVPYFNKAYLEGTRIKSGSRLSMGQVIEDLQFPFRKTVEDGVPYYTFDSRIDVARFNSRNELEYIGTDPAQLVYDNGGGPSFLPFNTAGTDLYNLNLCFGMKIEIPFYMTASGTIDGKDIVFEFSGDDDVWIFVDDELILDIGGCHRRVAGKINFRTQMGTVEGSFNPKVAFSKRLLYIDAALTEWTDPAAGLYNEQIAFYNKNTHFYAFFTSFSFDTLLFR
jgi:fibro-slime domain-containing protein